MKNSAVKKILLIINPNSGQGKKDIGIIRKYFTKKKCQLDIIHTEYKGHAAEISKKYSSDDTYDVIVGAGGDGTINEVITGLIGSDKKIGIIPWGTGNVFAREMNIPLKTKKACKVILKGKPVKIDIGRSNSGYFFLMCSAGFDAYTIKHTESLKIKKIFGKFTYIIGGIKAVLKYNYPLINVEFDDGSTEIGVFILISNTARYGSYFTISPDATPVDGFFDVYIYRLPGKFNLLKLLFQIILNAFTGTNKKIILKEGMYKKARKLVLKSESNVLSQLDGDIHDLLPLKINLIPQAVNIVLPKKITGKLIRLQNKNN